MLGTPGYMPPEHMGGGAASSPASDVYSLGAILYELASGHRPFDIETPFDAVLQILEFEPTQLSNEIQALLDERAAARRSGDWATADALRERLTEMGVVVRDEPVGK
jgi:serine/threonine protein kinase